MRISDWSSDVCSSDLAAGHRSSPIGRSGRGPRRQCAPAPRPRPAGQPPGSRPPAAGFPHKAWTGRLRAGLLPWFSCLHSLLSPASSSSMKRRAKQAPLPILLLFVLLLGGCVSAESWEAARLLEDIDAAGAPTALKQQTQEPARSTEQIGRAHV